MGWLLAGHQRIAWLRVTAAMTTITSAARRLIHRIGRIRSRPCPPVMASAATSQSPGL
jgi:hypothetical protein